MKLSELDAQTQRVNDITALRDARDAAADALEQLETNEVAVKVVVDWDYSDCESEITGTAVEHVKAALRQQIVDIEFELTQLGVEIDQPPNAASEDDASPDASQDEAA